MKKLSLILYIVILFSGCTKLKIKYFDFSIPKLKNYSISEEKKIPKIRIAIGNFYNYSRVGTNESDIIAREMLIEKFRKNNNFLIVDSKKNNELIEKLGFLEPKDLDFSMLKRNYLDVNYIIIGSLVSYNWKMMKQKNMFYNLNVEKTEVRLEFKIVDMVTGKVWSEIDEGTAHLATNNQTEDKLETNEFFYETLEKSTLKKAIDNAADKIIKKIEGDPWSSVVLEKKGDKLYINVHHDKVLPKGTKFDVYQQGELISYKDKVLGYEEKQVGVAKLVSYGEQERGILKYKGVDFLLPAVVKLK